MAKPEKTVCAISAKSFLDNAGPLKVMIGDQVLTAEARSFATGSFGWYINGKVTLEVDGKRIPVQVGANMIVVGSKEAARDDQPPAQTNGNKSAPAARR
jgi:hypothetical protein